MFWRREAEDQRMRNWGEDKGGLCEGRIRMMRGICVLGEEEVSERVRG